MSLMATTKYLFSSTFSLYVHRRQKDNKHVQLQIENSKNFIFSNRKFCHDSKVRIKYLNRFSNFSILKSHYLQSANFCNLQFKKFNIRARFLNQIEKFKFAPIRKFKNCQNRTCFKGQEKNFNFFVLVRFVLFLSTALLLNVFLPKKSFSSLTLFCHKF